MSPKNFNPERLKKKIIARVERRLQNMVNSVGSAALKAQRTWGDAVERRFVHNRPKTKWTRSDISKSTGFLLSILTKNSPFAVSASPINFLGKSMMSPDSVIVGIGNQQFLDENAPYWRFQEYGTRSGGIKYTRPGMIFKFIGTDHDGSAMIVKTKKFNHIGTKARRAFSHTEGKPRGSDVRLVKRIIKESIVNGQYKRHITSFDTNKVYYRNAY